MRKIFFASFPSYFCINSIITVDEALPVREVENMYEDLTGEELCKRWNTDEQKGLTWKEAERRLSEQGENTLKKGKERTILDMIQEQLNDPMIFVLFMAASISLLLREFGDTGIILLVIFLNTTIGVIQEGRAKKAMEALKKMTAPEAVVKREGVYKKIPASKIVCGDVVKLEAGDQIPADIRLLTCRGIETNESALTGESLPVRKEAKRISKGSPMIEWKNMVFMLTEVRKGSAEGIVVATGMDTELGKIAHMINETKGEMTPLQKRLGELGKTLSVGAVGLCMVLFLLGILQHRNILQMLLLSISLAVAAIPEGLPAVVTIVLALGVARMAKANTIIRKLPAVETLGSVGVLCSDKTGTLTQNKMKVVKVYGNDRLLSVNQMRKREFPKLVEGFLLCNNSVLGKQEIGDSTELALLHMGKEMGYTREKMEERYPRVREIPFDSEKKYMITVHKDGNNETAYVKGACDYLLECCSFWWVDGMAVPMTQVHRMKIRMVMESMAREGLRVLALAFKQYVKDQKEKEIMRSLTFAGLAGMMDPPRPKVRQSVGRLKQAGVQVVMITGDYKDTAFAVARNIGIAESFDQCMTGMELDTMSEAVFKEKMKNIRVFARVTPAHKVKIVQRFRENGEIVAMTGDGVNDAPSLQAADIGIAMGANGTDVAKNAADMILTDDNFATIERAMEEGRSIYVNIKKSILFLLSSNFGEILTMFAAVLFSLPTPLKASHILWVNLITDSLPALALGVDKNDWKTLMSQRPRDPKEGIFAHGGWFCTIFYGLLIGSITLYAFFKGGQTYAFTVLGISQLFHAIGMRDREKSVFCMNHLENPFMIVAFFLGIGLQAAVTEIPWLVEVFQIHRLSLGEWLWLIKVSAIPVLAHELLLLQDFLRKIAYKNKKPS